MSKVLQALTHQQIRVLVLFYMCMSVTWAAKTFMKPCFLKDPQNQPKEKDQEKHQIVAATKLHPPMLVNQSRNCQFHKSKCYVNHTHSKPINLKDISLWLRNCKENRYCITIFWYLKPSFKRGPEKLKRSLHYNFLGLWWNWEVNFYLKTK